tara:strand:- start:29 stop:727 length:699 start_codon:yes stop_codon:yes gene_type:complete
MKKLVLIFFIIPTFIYGQDVPLTEKKVTTESMENKERKLKEKADDKVRKENTKRTNKYNRLSAMHPKNQIGYIMNPSSCPFGFNYYNLESNARFGFYFDYKNDFGVSSGLEVDWTGYAADEGAQYRSITETDVEGGYLVYNAGVTFAIIKTKKNAFIVYFGVGLAKQKVYDEWTTNWEYSANETSYVRNGYGNEYNNLSYGILLQSNSLISWQLGFDSAVPGINFGMGFTWN